MKNMTTEELLNEYSIEYKKYAKKITQKTVIRSVVMDLAAMQLKINTGIEECDLPKKYPEYFI